MRLRSAAALSLALAVAPRDGGAQRTRAQLDAARECLRHIPPAAMKTVMVYVSASVAAPQLAPGEARRDMLASADALASAVADHIRSRLGGSPGVLPSGDSLMTWIGLGPDLDIVARRGQPLRWSFDELGEESDGTGIMARALADAVADGETFVWPAGLTADSVFIHMTLHAPQIARDGSAQPIMTDAAVAVFTLHVPWEEPLERPGVLRLDVERGWLDAPTDGVVQLGVIVDTTGHVDPDIIRELAPLDDRGRPLPALARVWKAARARALTMRFKPERIGGCTVPTPYPLTFSFIMR